MPNTAEAIAALRAAAEADGRQFFAISTLTGEGLEALIGACAQEVKKLRAEMVVDTSTPSNDRIWERRRRERDRAFTISNLGGGVFRVSGPAVERMVVQTDWDNDEAILFLQHRFERMGLDDALEKAGCTNGDEVRILDYSFNYEGLGGDDRFAELDDIDDAVLSEFEEEGRRR